MKRRRRQRADKCVKILWQNQFSQFFSFPLILHLICRNRNSTKKATESLALSLWTCVIMYTYNSTMLNDSEFSVYVQNVQSAYAYDENEWEVRKIKIEKRIRSLRIFQTLSVIWRLLLASTDVIMRGLRFNHCSSLHSSITITNLSS